MHDDLEALERLNALLDVVSCHEQDREFVFHARRRIKRGEELPESWRDHMGKLLIELGTMQRFDAESESYR